MKKYVIGFLVLGLMVLGFSAPKAEAGLTNAQTQAVINLLNAFNANATTIAAVQAALTSSGNATPSTSAGTTPGTVNPNAQYPYGTTPTSGNPSNPTVATPSTPTTPTTPTSGSNGCYSNQTNMYAYNAQNGYQCVKACPSLVTASNTNYWNVLTNSVCPSYTPPTLSTSIMVKYPNGGEVFAPGDTVVVKWSSENIPSTNDNVFVLLNYYDANGNFIVNSVLDDHLMNDGGEEVKLPDTLPSGAMWGAYFKISVGTTNDSGTSLGSDMSDTFFTIQ